MIYAGEQGPWRSSMQIFNKKNKKVVISDFKLGWNTAIYRTLRLSGAVQPRPS
jgi:hypothetical protein